MKKLLILTIILFNNMFCNAQNIIPNGSFEQFYGCPDFPNQFDSVMFWFNPSINTISHPRSSPDYFNSCDTTYLVSIPYNWVGFQNSYTGQAYSGITLYSDLIPNYREYIEVPLNTPLIANNCYQLEMYVCLADYSDFNTNELGVYFSDTIISNLTTRTVLPYIPQINNVATNVFNKLNWTVITGTYFANGGENYLIIGSFKDDSNTPLTSLSSNYYMESYIYIDDVSLTSCLTALDENNNIEISVYPNPFNQKINITINGPGNFLMNLFDITGKIVLNQNINYYGSINTDQLSKGLYFYEILRNKEIIKKGKVVKN